MTTIDEATYDGSAFRPAQPVALQPNTEVRLIVETKAAESKPTSFLDTAQSLKLEGPPDWSANVDRLSVRRGRTSFVVMSERGIAEALTSNTHFEQAGFVALLRR